MDIILTREKEVNGTLTVKVTKADYADNVQKSLKKIKKQAKMPGFRPGMVPMGLIQKMYGLEVKAEEMQKLVSESINNYIKEQKLELMTSPVNTDADKVDVETCDDFEMHFEVGLAPEFSITLDDKDSIPYYDIEITDEMVNTEVDMYRRRQGSMEESETYSDGDLMRGKLVELDGNGQVKEGGISIDETSIMPKYFSNEDQKKLFEGAQKGDVVFNVSKAYDGKDTEIAAILKVDKEEVAQHTGDFKYTITSISHMKPAEVNQELFDVVFGKDTVKDESEFRARIKEKLEKVYVQDSDYKLILDVKDSCRGKVGELTLPEELIKKEMLKESKDEKGREEVENQFPQILKERKWYLIYTRLIDQLNVKVDDETIKEAAKVVARSQFAQYGLNDVPEEYIDNYAGQMMKDKKQFEQLLGRAYDIELTKAIKNTVKLDHQTISVKDFNAKFNA